MYKNLHNEWGKANSLLHMPQCLIVNKGPHHLNIQCYPVFPCLHKPKQKIYIFSVVFMEYLWTKMQYQKVHIMSICSELMPCDWLVWYSHQWAVVDVPNEWLININEGFTLLPANWIYSVCFSLHPCVSDVTPASFETPVERSTSPSSTYCSKGVDGGEYQHL